MEQIVISDIIIDVVRKDIKNIHIAVYPPTGRVRLAAPLQVSEDAIRLFAISKLAWIKRNQRLLNIIEADAPPKVILKNKTYIDLFFRPGTPTFKRLEIMNKWYQVQLKKLIPDLIEKWEKILGVTVDEWQVKQMKTKWGSCNIEQRRIWINLELAKKPERCLEYIIVHEMIHLLKRHHNDRFHHHLENHLPNWRQLKDELNH